MRDTYSALGGAIAAAAFGAGLLMAGPALANENLVLAFNTQAGNTQPYAAADIVPADGTVIGRRLQVAFVVPDGVNGHTARLQAQNRLAFNAGNVFALAGNTDGIENATDVVRHDGHIMLIAEPAGVTRLASAQ